MTILGLLEVKWLGTENRKLEEKIDNWLRAGRQDTAIRAYREFHGLSLKRAQREIDGILSKRRG